VGATDISAGALSVARRNALAHGVADRMDFFQGDLLAAVSGNFDIICSNPPYIPDVQYGLLPAGIRDFEPRGALIAGPDGMDFHRRIIREGVHRLKAEGRIFLEIGDGQRDQVKALFQEASGYDDISFRRDYGGIDRVASARRPGQGEKLYALQEKSGAVPPFPGSASSGIKV
jgi:release factor glutamine methyltransferase